MVQQLVEAQSLHGKSLQKQRWPVVCNSRLACALILPAALASVTTIGAARTWAQESEPPLDPNIDRAGFSDRRGALRLLPFEHVDPFTGNLLLTFTDVELPGNAGMNLRIMRTYNSSIYGSKTYNWIAEDSWAGVGWTLHLGRILLSMNDQPILELPDGSRSNTTVTTTSRESPTLPVLGFSTSTTALVE